MRWPSVGYREFVGVLEDGRYLHGDEPRPEEAVQRHRSVRPTTAGSTDNGTLTVSSKKPDAVATATLTGKSTAAPTCTAGNEDFSGFADGSKPTAFGGGTIDSAYVGSPGVKIQGISSGWRLRRRHARAVHRQRDFVRLSFTDAVSSVQLDAEFGLFANVDVTLTAFDASDSVVGSGPAGTGFP